MRVKECDDTLEPNVATFRMDMANPDHDILRKASKELECERFDTIKDELDRATPNIKGAGFERPVLCRNKNKLQRATSNEIRASLKHANNLDDSDELKWAKS